MRRKVFIATPTTKRQVVLDNGASVAKMVANLERQGIETLYSAIDWSRPINEKRDWLAHHFRTATDATHLLFIDDDMDAVPDLAATLLGFDKNVVGVFATKRKIDLKAYAAAIRNGADDDAALAMAHEFVGTLDPNGPIEAGGDLRGVLEIGGAFMLISRACIEHLARDAEHYLSFADEHVAGIFKPHQEPGKKPMSEDISFCRRARGAGFTIFAYIKARIWHIGTMKFGVPFDQYLDAKDNAPRWGHGYATYLRQSQP